MQVGEDSCRSCCFCFLLGCLLGCFSWAASRRGLSFSVLLLLLRRLLLLMLVLVLVLLLLLLCTRARSSAPSVADSSSTVCLSLSHLIADALADSANSIATLPLATTTLVSPLSYAAAADASSASLCSDAAPRPISRHPHNLSASHALAGSVMRSL